MQKRIFLTAFFCVLVASILFTTKNALAQYSEFSWFVKPSASTLITPIDTSKTATMQITTQPTTFPPIASVAPSITFAKIPTPTFSPAPSPKPARTITPTAIITQSPAIQSSSFALSAVQQTILDGVNAYRKSQGLSAISADSTVCNFAATRAQEITYSFAHDGFQNRINNHTLPYSSYHSVTENIAMNSDYTQVVPMWIASAGHAENMRADTPYVCVAQSGNYYAYEGWKP